MVFGSYGHFWSRSNNCVLILRSVGGCLGGFWVLWPLLVLVQQLCIGCLRRATPSKSVVCVCACMFVCECVHICVWYVCVYLCVCACGVCVYIYVCVCTS